MTIAEAAALIGHTFERDGERFTFLGVNVEPGKFTDLKIAGSNIGAPGYRWVCIEFVEHWIKEATEVFP